MASYLSKPTEYAAYQPTVDADLYGKLLMKKEADYQTGVEKVNKNLDYVASLPMASERERIYLQDKVNSITNQLNSNLNTDWSDQATQQITATHIKDITNDDKVKTAIYNASVAKKGFSEMKRNSEATDNKNIANSSSFLKKFNEWEQNGKLGEKLNASYSNYIDVDQVIDDEMKKLHPDIVEMAYSGMDPNLPKQALGLKGWETVTMKMKGSPAYKQTVLDTLHRVIENTPGIANQMNINSEYLYQGHTGENYYNEVEQSHQKNIDIANDWIEGYTTQLTSGNLTQEQKKNITESIKNAKEFKSKYENELKEIKLNKANFVNRYNTDEAFRNKYNNDLYMNSFLTEKYNVFTSGSETTFDTKGLSPLQQAHQDFEERMALRRDAREQSKEQREQSKFQKSQSDESMYVPASGLETKAADREKQIDIFDKELTNQKNDLEQEKINFLYNVYSGVNGININDYFTQRNVDGTVQWSLNPNKRDELLRTLSEFMYSKKKGEYNVAGNPIKLSNMQVENIGHLLNMDQNIADQTKMKNDIIDQAINSDPELKNAIDSYIRSNTKIPESGKITTVAGNVYSGIDIKRATYDNDYYGAVEHVIPDNIKQVINKRAKNHFETINNLMARTNAIYKGGQYIISIKGDTDKETEENYRTTLGKIQKVIDYGTNVDKTAQELINLASSKTGIVTFSQGRDPEKNQYFYELSSGNTKGRVYVTNTQAESLGFNPNLTTNITNLDRRLSLYGGTTRIPNQDEVETAMELGSVGNKEYRFHADKSRSGQFYVTVYEIDTSTGKVIKVNNNDMKAGYSQNDLNAMVQTLKKQYSNGQ